MLRQKRAAKRKLNPKPDVPAEGCDAARDAIACTKTTLNRFVRPENEDFQQLLERTVLAINQMTKRVSMLAKELLLTMLEHGSPLPTSIPYVIVRYRYLTLLLGIDTLPFDRYRYLLIGIDTF
jgi:hypothetical protein